MRVITPVPPTLVRLCDRTSDTALVAAPFTVVPAQVPLKSGMTVMVLGTVMAASTHVIVTCPIATPVTRPVEETVAIAVLDDDQAGLAAVCWVPFWSVSMAVELIDAADAGDRGRTGDRQLHDGCRRHGVRGVVPAARRHEDRERKCD